MPSLRHALALALLVVPCLRAQGEGLRTRVSIRTEGTELGTLVTALGVRAGLNTLIAPEVQNKKVSMQLTDVPLIEVLRYLRGLYQVGIGITPDRRTILLGTREAIERLDMGETRTIRVSNRDPEELAELINKVYQGKVLAIGDKRSSTVILVPTP